MKATLGDPQLNFLVGINLLVLLSATALSRGQFIDPYNLQSMAAQVPELALLALGVMLSMISGNGGIDLSGIALANLAGVAAAAIVTPLVSPEDAPMLYSAGFVGAALMVGFLGGLLNGALIAFVNLTPILCTLGTQLLFSGLSVVLSRGTSMRVASVPPLHALGNGDLLGVPTGFVIFAVIALATGMLLKYSPFGVRLFLLGTNPKAARYAGLPQKRLLVGTYALCGLLAGMAAVLIASRNLSVKWDYGRSYLLIAILIAVMAGVKPEGGYGRVICLFLSAISLQLLSSMFNFLDVSNFFRDCAWGLLLLLFLAFSGFKFKTFGVRQFKVPPKRTSAPPTQTPPASSSRSRG
jgi:simple sugar transport system permease protein